jgi:uncharacterized protein (DUF427 family)
MTAKRQAVTNSGPGYAKYPDHTVIAAKFLGEVSVCDGDTVIAETTRATLLTESGYRPVYYIPNSDVRFDLLEEVELSTHCPFKGNASYWRVIGQNEPSVWGYLTPFDEVAVIKDHVAFYDDRVRVSVTDAV